MSRIGKTVLYTLSEQDVKEIIERRRLIGDAIAKGNEPRVGQEYPAVVLADWGGSANLRVLLDGYDEHWGTSRPEWTDAYHRVVYWYVDEDGDRTLIPTSRHYLIATQDHATTRWTYQGSPVEVERAPTHEFTWREIPTE